MSMYVFCNLDLGRAERPLVADLDNSTRGKIFTRQVAFWGNLGLGPAEPPLVAILPGSRLIAPWRPFLATSLQDEGMGPWRKEWREGGVTGVEAWVEGKMEFLWARGRGFVAEVGFDRY